MLQWMITLLGGTSWLVPVLWLIGIVVALFFIIRTVYRAWPSVARFVVTMNALSDLPQFMERTDEGMDEQNSKLDSQTLTLAKQDRKILEIHHEVRFNNGSSVKDGITRVEEGVKGLYDKFDDVEKQIGKLDETNVEQWSAIEHTQPKAAIEQARRNPKGEIER